MHWAQEYLVKRAMFETLGGWVAPYVGGPESRAAAEAMKMYGPQAEAYSLIQGLAGKRMPQRLLGAEFSQLPSGQGRVSWFSPSKRKVKPGKPRKVLRSSTTIPWEQIPSAARAHFIGGQAGPYAVAGNLAHAARTAEPARQQLRRLGLKTGLGAVGGIAGTILLSRLLGG